MKPSPTRRRSTLKSPVMRSVRDYSVWATIHDGVVTVVICLGTICREEWTFARADWPRHGLTLSARRYDQSQFLLAILGIDGTTENYCLMSRLADEAWRAVDAVRVMVEGTAASDAEPRPCPTKRQR